MRQFELPCPKCKRVAVSGREDQHGHIVVIYFECATCQYQWVLVEKHMEA